ncbi:hypothetical protein AUJ68_02035 [Candidatus Woesearchaeota archaeon CG1_02_57_44]|nr:MAG: hypothetical protein AUJ68_02035 [Candidatus Woesearchaeota archaeon CG1_02_57_44]
MVLELLVGPTFAERRPQSMFLYGVFFAAIAIILSLWIFPQWASLMIVFLTTLSCVYLVERTLRMELKSDINLKGEAQILRHHTKALLFFIFLFMGFTVAYSLGYLLLGPAQVQTAFSEQISELTRINGGITGRVVDSSVLFIILSNNFKVLFFVTFFAFFYGAGVVFILAWNASVIAVAIGNFSRRLVAEAAARAGATGLTAHFQVFSIGVARYMTHGVLEIMAYFIAALAGGIISFAVINRHINNKSLAHILMDGADLIALSAMLLLVAGVVEVYITPLIF